jgi:hypothetical protein
MRNLIEAIQHFFMNEFGIGHGDAADIAAKIKDDVAAARKRAEDGEAARAKKCDVALVKARENSEAAAFDADETDLETVVAPVKPKLRKPAARKKSKASRKRG